MDSNYYLKFEDKFRGDRQSIIDRLSVYDPLLDTLIKSSSNINMLDIGSGRGEWLQKCRDKIPDSIGIEFDKNMINLCKKNKLNILEGDVMHLLPKFKNESISIISIFHVIEHLDNENLQKLIFECQRILKNDGVLIMETPSIDNILVATKQFYLDPTHVNPINPDGISFLLESSGFYRNKYFFINGGPLQKSNPIKITRILNGVAQDLLFVATKNNSISNLLFEENVDWEFSLGIAPTTLEAAIDYDLEREKEQRELIEKLKTEIKYLKILVRYQLNIFSFLKTILRPFYKSARKIKKYFLIIFQFTYDKVFPKRLFLFIFRSKKFLKVIGVLFKYLPGKYQQIGNTKINNKLKNLGSIDLKSSEFNNNLMLHYESSLKAKDYKKSFIKKKRL